MPRDYLFWYLKVSSHLANGADSSLLKSSPCLLRFKVFKYIQEQLQPRTSRTLNIFNIFDASSHATFSTHTFKCLPSRFLTTHAHYAGCQLLSTGFVYPFVLNFLCYSLFSLFLIDDQILCFLSRTFVLPQW